MIFATTIIVTAHKPGFKPSSKPQVNAHLILATKSHFTDPWPPLPTLRHQPSTLTDLPEDFLVHSEGEVQDVMDVIVLHPLQALVELLVQVLEVTQVTQTRMTHRQK